MSEMVEKEVLSDIRRRLEAERTSLHSQLAALEVENKNQHDDSGMGNHLADDASELFVRERNIALQNNTRDLLRRVDVALARIDAGVYGICGRCGQLIDAERLEALPHAILCITCQSEVERHRF